MTRTFDVDWLSFVVSFSISLTLSLAVSLFSSLLASNVPSAAEAMNFVRDDIQPVIEFAIDSSMQAALAATSIHAFIVVAKKFLD